MSICVYIRECSRTLYEGLTGSYSSDANTKVYGDGSTIFKSICFCKFETG